MRFEHQRALLFIPGETMSVPQVPTTSGLLYTNRSTTFTIDANKARLQMPRAAADHRDCVNQPDEASRALR